jgi:transposase
VSGKVVPVTYLAGTTLDTVVESGNRKGRPNDPIEFKWRLASAACEPGVSVSKLAQEHGINVNRLFKWRRDLRAGLLAAPGASEAKLLSVVLTRSDVPALPPPRPRGTGTIEIAIADAVVRVGADADAALLRLIIQSLRP